jgi:hypothetical protein
VPLTGTVSGSDVGRLGDATVTFLDGVNVGRSATTNSNGEYRFESVTEGNANLAASASGYGEERRGVFVNGTNTLNFTLQRTGPSSGGFGPGRWIVGTDIQPGRYFTDPDAGCEWEREVSSGVITANDRWARDAEQLIVDILPGDRAFRTNAACRTWSTSNRGGTDGRIPPGIWLRQQVGSGEFESEVENGCHVERLRAFRGDSGDVIQSADFGRGGQRIRVDSGDTGVRSGVECGTWQRR